MVLLVVPPVYLPVVWVPDGATEIQDRVDLGVGDRAALLLLERATVLNVALGEMHHLRRQSREAASDRHRLGLVVDLRQLVALGAGRDLGQRLIGGRRLARHGLERRENLGEQRLAALVDAALEQRTQATLHPRLHERAHRILALQPSALGLDLARQALGVLLHHVRHEEVGLDRVDQRRNAARQALLELGARANQLEQQLALLLAQHSCNLAIALVLRVAELVLRLEQPVEQLVLAQRPDLIVLGLDARQLGRAVGLGLVDELARPQTHIDNDLVATRDELSTIASLDRVVVGAEPRTSDGSR